MQAVFTGPVSFGVADVSIREAPGKGKDPFTHKYTTQMRLNVSRKTKNGCFGEHSASARRLKKRKLVDNDKLIFARHSPDPCSWDLVAHTHGSAHGRFETTGRDPQKRFFPAFCHYPLIMGCLFS